MQPEFNILVIGDRNTGKSNIVSRFMGAEFKPGYKATIGADLFKVVYHFRPKKQVALSFWDMSGDPKDADSTLSPLIGQVAHAAIVVFDASRPETFASVSNWKARLDAVKKIPTIIVANKSDLKSSQELLEGCDYEVSAKDNRRIADALDALVQKLLPQELPIV